jgi:predicted metal-dependent peptidase
VASPLHEGHEEPGEDAAVRRLISASLLWLRTRAPFFGALTLFARIILREDEPTAATNGRDIFINPAFLRSLDRKEVDGVILHEVLHAALLHVPRRGARDPLLWNIAADIVVNGMIAGLPGVSLPAGTLRDRELEKFSVEEVYELLLKNGTVVPGPLPFGDLRELPPGVTRADLEAHWTHARTQAATLARSRKRGDLPAGMARELGALEPARLDWRAHLWRYLVRTPTDFEGFDRRFISRGLYLETLAGESLRVFIAVDTSGSVTDRELQLFLGEVRGVLRAYPHVVCDLYYADAAVDGPHHLGTAGTLPPPRGGGGTDFRPFFERVAKTVRAGEEGVCIYLTDGFGAFPEAAPRLPVLWVVTPGGEELDAFPFGETVRLIAAE